MRSTYTSYDLFIVAPRNLETYYWTLGFITITTPKWAEIKPLDTQVKLVDHDWDNVLRMGLVNQQFVPKMQLIVCDNLHHKNIELPQRLTEIGAIEEISQLTMNDSF